jgi:arylsulfatase A-like enzyme
MSGRMKSWSRREFLQAPAAAAAAPQAGSVPPNIIILFADDLGYSDLSCYGNPVIRTPNLDRMAAEGTRFTSFYSAASVCSPARAGLLTGRHPIRAGQPNNTGPETTGGLPLSEVLLPQVLKPRGYRTMAIGKWHLGHQPKAQLPVSRGFDSWFGLPYSNDMIPPWVKTDVPLRLYRDAEPIEELGDYRRAQANLTPRYTEEAVRFIRANRTQPFFLYLPYSMPHLPVSVPAANKRRSRGGLYGDVIETLDWSVGEIMRTVREAGADSRTMVVFTSDNGPWHDLPARMLADGVEPWDTGTKGPFRAAKGTSYEGGFRVPGIVRWPGVVRAGQVSLDMASSLDLFPTIAAAAGVAMPDDRRYDGWDLMAHLRDGRPSPRREFFYSVGRQLHAVREGPWKFRLAGNNPQPELFHLEWDPGEQYNRARTEPETARRLAARLKAFGAEVGAQLSPGL